jgi:6-phosphogluconolactonase
MLFATASAEGKGRSSNRSPASVRLYEWAESSRMPLLIFETADVPSPSFLAFAKESRTLFATSEMQGEGQVSAFALEDQRLVFRGSRLTYGNAAVHIALDRSNQWLAVANYRAERAGDDMAVAIFPISAGGEIGPAAAALPQAGHGPDRSRQDGPHTHCVMLSPDNRLLAAVDLGTDGLWLYHFDQETGAAGLAREVKLPAGCGPRHCVFHPSRPLIYVCGELDSTLMTLRYDSIAGTAELIDVDAATKAGYSGRNYPSGLAISSDGHYLMLGNRGADTIAVFWIDPEIGTAKLRDEISCGGDFPRAIRLDRTGALLAVANQRCGNVALFHRDFGTGRLSAVAAMGLA